MNTVENAKNSKRKTLSTSAKSSIVKTLKAPKKIPVSSNKPGKKLKTCKHEEDWQQKSKLLFHLNPASMALISLQERKFTDVNEAFLKTLGFSRKEVFGKTSEELNIFVQLEKMQTSLEQLLEQGYFNNYELKIRRKDGQILDGLFSGEIIEIQGKKYFLIIMIDLTSRKRSEKALRESEEKYRTILENIPEGYFETDLAGNFTFFSDAVCRIHGYPKEELMGMNNRQYTDKKIAKKVFHAFNKIYNTREPLKGFDWQIIRKDGAKRYVEASVSLQEDSTGKPIGFRGLIRDITERKQTEELLKQGEAQYRLLADHIKDQVWLMDLNLKGHISAHLWRSYWDTPLRSLNSSRWISFSRQHLSRQRWISFPWRCLKHWQFLQTIPQSVYWNSNSAVKTAGLYGLKVRLVSSGTKMENLFPSWVKAEILLNANRWNMTCGQVKLTSATPLMILRWACAYQQ